MQFTRSDAGLLRAYVRGNYKAFETLYRRHSEALFNYTFRTLGLYEVAEEIAQDVWLTVLDKAESYSAGNSEFRTWLFTIARNRVIDHRRRRINQQHGDVSELEIPARQLNQEEQLLLRQLLLALNDLPEQQRESFILLHEGFSHREIADITGVGSETVKSRLRYARTSLKRQLGGQS